MQEQLQMYKEMFPTRIVPVGRKRAFLCDFQTLKFQLQASPIIEDTWHDQPMVDGSDSKKSNWKFRAGKDLLPKVGMNGATNAVPKDISGGKAKDMLPVGVKISFAKENNEYEKFLEGPSLVSKGEVFIHGPFAQGPSHVKVNVDKNMVKIEKFSREGIRDCFGVTNMIQMISDRLKSGIEGGLISENGEAWDTFAEMRLVQKWLDIILISSFRTGAMLQSMHVMAKDSLREETLNNLYGSAETKDNLRYSHYATEDMFGPLSSEFEPYVSPANSSHEKYKLTPRYGSVGASSQNKGGSNSSSAGSGQNRNATRGNKGGRSGHMTENRTSYVSPQDVLRRSRDNNNNRRGRAGNRNQSFRGRQGQGRRYNQNTKRK